MRARRREEDGGPLVRVVLLGESSVGRVRRLLELSGEVLEGCDPRVDEDEPTNQKDETDGTGDGEHGVVALRRVGVKVRRWGGEDRLRRGQDGRRDARTDCDISLPGCRSSRRLSMQRAVTASAAWVRSGGGGEGSTHRD